MILSDEIALQPRLRWSEHDNKIHGICNEHSMDVPVVFKDLQDLDLVASAIRDGRCHLAKESLVFVLVRLGDSAMYSTYPILSIPICSHSNYELQQTVFATLETHFRKCERKFNCGKLLNIGTDGEGTRRRILHNFTTRTKPGEKQIPKRVRTLTSLSLFDVPRGPSCLTVNKDAKHLMKRFRNRGIGAGYSIGPFKFNKVLLHRFMDDYNENTPVALLAPADKQNVAMAHRLLVNLAKVAASSVDDVALPLRAFLPEMRILGTISDSLCSLYAKYTLDLQSILVELSLLAHLLFAVFRMNGTGFIPSQLYYDIQGSVIDIYTSVAKYRAWCPETKLFVYQNGSDECEGRFSVIRTTTHDRNCDILQLGERLQHSATLKTIFQRHPEMRNHVGRRLSITEGVDHTSPRHWTGDLLPGNCDIGKAWQHGNLKAEALLADCKWYTPIDPEGKDSEDLSLLKPKGMYVGVREDDDPDDTGSDEEDIVEEQPSDMEEDIDTFEDMIQVVGHDTVTRHIVIDGNVVHKASVIRDLNMNNYKISTDRLRRVRGLSASPYEHRDELKTLIVGDPCAALVRKSSDITLVLIIAQDVEVNPDGIPVKITGRVMELELEPNNGGLLWNRELDLNCKPVVAHVFETLDMTYKAEEQKILFETTDLERCHELLVSRIVDKQTIPLTASKFVPYPLDSLTESDARDPSTTAATTDGWSCDICSTVDVPRKQFRRHVGEHILAGELPSDACGFCGTVPQCNSYVERTSGSGGSKNFGVNSNCSKFIKFSLKAAAKSTRSGPCTNRPFYCNVNPCTAATVWSYGAEGHYAKFHPGNIPDEYKVSAEERKWMTKKKRV